MAVSDQLSVERAAQRLRHEILHGEHAPGAHLDEVGLAARLDISRNGLREAFRLLAQERLVRHEPHRGVFVRRIDAAAARETYEVRRHLECGGVREAFVQVLYARALLAGAGSASEQERARRVLDTWDNGLHRAEEAVEQGEAAGRAGDWRAVGSANAHFHAALGSLGGNGVLQQMLGSLLTETRLRFLELGVAQEIHEPFLADNRRILTLLQLGEGARAVTELEAYLLRARALFASDVAG